MIAAATTNVAVLAGIWAGALCLMLILTGVLIRRRLRGPMGDLPRIRRGARLAYLAVLWTYLLILIFGMLWISGHALIAVAVLVGYAFLLLAFLMVMVAIMAKRETPRDYSPQPTDSEDE
jgi:cytosine/uracil/thiamine/allantoin permease